MVPTAPSVLCQPGAARLQIDRVDGASAVTRAFASSPLKLLTPVPRGACIHACLSSFGGGVVAGDHTRLDLALAAGTAAVVGTQSSTKVYRDPRRLTTSHTLAASVADEAMLVAAPDPVQPFADSHYAQSQTFHLAPTASLAAVDWMSAGRIARGERWAFHDYRSRTEIHVDGRPVLLDQLHLDASAGGPAGTCRTAGYNALATVILLGPRTQLAAERARADIQSLPPRPGQPLVGSASPLRDGLLIRLASTSTERLLECLVRWLHTVGSESPAHPWARRW